MIRECPRFETGDSDTLHPGKTAFNEGHGFSRAVDRTRVNVLHDPLRDRRTFTLSLWNRSELRFWHGANPGVYRIRSSGGEAERVYAKQQRRVFRIETHPMFEQPRKMKSLQIRSHLCSLLYLKTSSAGHELIR